MSSSLSPTEPSGLKVVFPHPGALLNDAWFIMISQAFVNPALNFFSVPTFMRMFSRQSLRKKLQKGGKPHIVQAEAQKKFEKSKFDPAVAYSSFTNIIFTSFFFQPILPSGLFFALVGLLLNYFVFKFKLLRMSKTPVQVPFTISAVVLYLLNLVPLGFGISSVVFDEMLRQKIHTNSYVILVVGIISMIFPLYLFFLNSTKECFRSSNKVEQNYNTDYDMIRSKFTNEYDRANPITKEQGQREYFEYMRQTCKNNAAELKNMEVNFMVAAQQVNHNTADFNAAAGAPLMAMPFQVAEPAGPNPFGAMGGPEATGFEALAGGPNDIAGFSALGGGNPNSFEDYMNQQMGMGAPDSPGRADPGLFNSGMFAGQNDFQSNTAPQSQAGAIGLEPVPPFPQQAPLPPGGDWNMPYGDPNAPIYQPNNYAPPMDNNYALPMDNNYAPPMINNYAPPVAPQGNLYGNEFA